MSLVLDASVTLAFLYRDEDAALPGRVFRQVAASHAVVPSLWRLEVANALTAGPRRNRIDRAFRDAALADLGVLQIVVDHETDGCAWSATLALADRHGLSLYDAAYLELAVRLGLPLGSLDTALLAAARAEGVAVLA